MFRTHVNEIAGVPGMFGDGLTHWHGVSRALASHWFHVSVKRFHDGRFVAYEEMVNDEPRLVELLVAQDEELVVQEVQVVSPSWMNQGSGWRMEKLELLSMGYTQAGVPTSVLEVEGGAVYVDTHDPCLDVDSLTGLKELYRSRVARADAPEEPGRA